MPHVHADLFLRHIRKLAVARSMSKAPDHELLDRFVRRKDQEAFEVLVQRHGPMVWHVCWRVLYDWHSAEDAFQAAFLVLARKAATIRRREALAGWLYGVAYRVTARARVDAVRTRGRERELPAEFASDSTFDVSWREACTVLDEELRRLPERYRAPLLLCYFEGRTRDEAAEQLGWSLGTFKRRLAQGRDLLRERLTRRGVTLSAGLVAEMLSQQGASAMPALLVSSTVKAAATFDAGTVAAAVSPRAIALAEAVAKSIATNKVKVVAAVLLAGSLFAAGSGFVIYQTVTVDKPGTDHALPKLVVKAPEKPKREETPQARSDRYGDLLPSLAVARLGTRRLCGMMDPMWASFSPDGTKLASQNWYGITVWEAATGRQLIERKEYLVREGTVGWRADGTGVAVVKLPDWSYFVSAFTDPAEKLPNPPRAAGPPGNPNAAGFPGPDVLDFMALSPDATRLALVVTPRAEQFTINLLPATPGRLVSELKPERTLGPFPGPCREVRFAADGRLVILTGPWAEKGDWSVAIVDSDKNSVARTTRIPPPGFCVWRYMLSLSPDARLAAFPARSKLSTNTHDGTIRVWDLVAGKELWRFPFPQRGYGTGHAFTPDGKQLITSTDKIYFQVWDLATGKEVARSPVPGGLPGQEASAVTVSRDGKRFATFRRDGRVDIWDTATGKAVVPLATHRDVVDAVAVSPNGQLAATLGYDDSVRVWELGTGKPGCVIPAALGRQPHGRFWSKPRLTFTPDGSGLLFTAAGHLEMADPATGKRLDLAGGLRGLRANVGAFTSDGMTLATFADDAVTLWEWPAGNARVTVTVPLEPGKPAGPDEDRDVVTVNSTAVSSDGRFLFTDSIRWQKHGGVHNANDLWDARNGKHRHRLALPQIEYPPAVFAPGRQLLYLGGSSFDNAERGRKRTDALTAWDPAAGTLLRRFADPKPDAGSGDPTGMRSHRMVEAIALSPDNRLLAAAEGAFSPDHIVWLYETASGRVIKKLAGHSRWVTDLAFTPDGRRLVTVSQDQTGLVWDVTLPALGGGPRANDPSGKALSEAWDQLAGPDPGRAFAGMAELAATPAEGLPLLRAKLRPAPIPTDADLDRVVRQLDADGFADRQKAFAELERIGPNAVAGIKTRLTRVTSLEVRRQLMRFLELYDGPEPSPYHVRCARGAATLEAMGTADARALLAELAKGPAADPLTREAREATGRNGGR
jgi:RNA polymerase sigma factor (sigma-70 family)